MILSYFIVYLILFNYLEQRPVHSYHIVHTVFDDMIPFCEIFIIPYLLWFPYVILTVAYFLFLNKNKREYFQLIFNLMMGMTVFLIVSYVYPNAQHLRPTEFPRDNIFYRYGEMAVQHRHSYKYSSKYSCFLTLLRYICLSQTVRHFVIRKCKGCFLYPYRIDHHVNHVPETAFSD